MFNRKIFIAALAALSLSIAHAQVQNPGVQQSGNVTPGHCAEWGPGTGQIKDASNPCLAGTPSALTETNDTNVTLTLTGTPATALLQAVNVTVGWSGTLAAARLNSNVVQSFVNDTNVTASILNQVATLGWSGQLAIARGGTGATTQAGAAAAILPTATTVGAVLYWDGSKWAVLPGNNSGTQVLSETNLGIPAWSAAGTGTLTQLTAGTNITFSSGATCTTTCTINGPAAANPTATAGPAAINGSASTFMRSDAAPAVQAATNAQQGIMEGDGATISCAAGLCNSINHWNLLATITASASNPSDTTHLTATYNEYEIVLQNLIPAAAGDFCVMLLQQGGTFQTSGYAGVWLALGPSSTTSFSPTVYIPCSFSNTAMANNNEPGINGAYRIKNPSTAEVHPVSVSDTLTVQGATSPLGLTGTGYFNTGGAITGFEICMSTSGSTPNCSSNFTGGTVKIYGRN